MNMGGLPPKADDAFLPIEWSCHDTDGIGGSPVLDPLVVYVTPYELMIDEPDDATMRVRFHLGELVDDLVEGNKTMDGTPAINECADRMLRQVAFAFRGLAKKIEDFVEMDEKESPDGS